MLGIINIIKYKKLPLVFIILSSILYLIFAYDLARTDTLKLPLLYVGLFIFAYLVIKSSGFYFRILVIASVLFRLLFLFAIPNLSQDFYRFIWDGQMILSGLNPYLSTPDYQMELGALTNFPNQLELYHGMGSLSASNYTNYPPLNQLCFIIANLFPGHSILNSIVGMRILIIGADLGTLYFGKKLLEKLNIPSGRIFWYILNPFIIIELTGNLHFEGVMVFFFVWSLYLLHCRKWLISAIILACSISIKLIPIMFLPLFFKWFKKENAPEGSTSRCSEGCKVEKTCPYSALKIYNTPNGWSSVFDLPDDSSKHEEYILEQLKTTNYGRCVYRMENDQPDHYVTSMEFEDEITANFSMEAFTSYHGRRTRIMGSHGDIIGDMTEFIHTDFLTGKVTKWDISVEEEKNSGYQGGGHGGGDWGLVTDWIKAVKYQNPNVLTSTIDASVESHIMGFRAEKSREIKQIIPIQLT